MPCFVMRLNFPIRLLHDQLKILFASLYAIANAVQWQNDVDDCKWVKKPSKMTFFLFTLTLMCIIPIELLYYYCIRKWNIAHIGQFLLLVFCHSRTRYFKYKTVCSKQMKCCINTHVTCQSFVLLCLRQQSINILEI